MSNKLILPTFTCERASKIKTTFYFVLQLICVTFALLKIIIFIFVCLKYQFAV